jgi:hypothetical protein
MLQSRYYFRSMGFVIKPIRFIRAIRAIRGSLTRPQEIVSSQPRRGTVELI